MTEPMKTEDQKLEDNLYEAIDAFTGNREVHAPSLIKELKVIVANQVLAERERIKAEVKKQYVNSTWGLTIGGVLKAIDNT